MKRWKYYAIGIVAALLIAGYALAQVTLIGSRWSSGALEFYNVATGTTVFTVGTTGVTTTGTTTLTGSMIVNGVTGKPGVGPVYDVILCGDLPNNTTNYTSPVTGFSTGAFYAGTATAADLSYALAGSGCAAEDNTTEATADEVMFANNTFHVLGMYCAVSGSGSNGVIINLRSAAANLTPDVTVTIPTTETTAAVATVTTTAVAAGATFAARAITTEDLSAQDYWCNVKIQLIP